MSTPKEHLDQLKERERDALESQLERLEQAYENALWELGKLERLTGIQQESILRYAARVSQMRAISVREVLEILFIFYIAKRNDEEKQEK